MQESQEETKTNEKIESEEKIEKAEKIEIKEEKSGEEKTKEEKIEIKEKKENKLEIIKNFLKRFQTIKPDYFFILLLILIIGFTIYIRTQNIPYLKDVTTGNYTLGPDLDPFLYLRHAREIVTGKLQDPDMMRAAPLGCSNYAKTNLMPWAIVAIYKLLDIFFEPPTASIEFAAIIAPVIFFSLTLIVFFLFVRQVFKPITTKNKANAIALIATAFYAFMPAMLHRTTAGIPEIESLGMLWFWLAFLFFTLAWQDINLKKQIVYSILAGIFTGLMIYTWGGFRYIFMTFSLATFLIFLFQKDKLKNLIIYSFWIIPALIFSLLKFGIKITLTNITDTGLAIGVFILLIFDTALNKTKVYEKIKKIKLPESIISIIILLFFGILLLLILNPSSLIKIPSKIIEGMLYPFGRGRIGLTVAENQAPYIKDAINHFGFLFFIFIFGILFMFYEATRHFNKKEKILLNTFFIIYIITFIFSRISEDSILNGTNFISIFLYFSGLIIFLIFLIFTYINSYRKEDEKTVEDFKVINFSYFLILAFSFWMMISLRGAIRLFFIVSPMLILHSSFLFIKCFDKIKSKDEFEKFLWYFITIIIAIFLILTLISYVKATKYEARATVPYGYYQQWQKAMAWVRENTPEDAIFTHWWDYGYWVQTIGNRATVVDGGHPVSFWNHLMGREVLTTPEPITALQFMKAHNVSYLLLDPTDIGKYGAFSSIGSDASGKDRYSYIPTFIIDERLTEEKRNSTTYTFIGGSLLDDELIVNDTILPAFSHNAIIGGFKLPIEEGIIKQPEILIVYRGKLIKLNLRYLYYNKELYDFGSGLEGILYIIPYFDGAKINNMGAALWLSPKVAKGLFARLYLLNETFNNSIVLTYQQDDLIVEQLKQQVSLNNDIILFRGSLLGPIRIYKINYPENIKFYNEYLLTNEQFGWNEITGPFAPFDNLTKNENSIISSLA
ncbi:MAG: STT3 domain-containing protein [Candidatus Pacearchaeota archaeon]